MIKKPSPIASFKKLVGRKPPSISEVIQETTSGGIVYRKNNKTNGALEILLIKDSKGRWTIPKGHVEPGEEHGATAEREIREETGLRDMEALFYLGKVNFRYRRNQSLVLMTMHIWLVKALNNTDELNPEEWLTGVQWMPASEAVDKIAYDDIGKLILIAMKRIREGNL